MDELNLSSGRQSVKTVVPYAPVRVVPRFYQACTRCSNVQTAPRRELNAGCVWGVNPYVVVYSDSSLSGLQCHFNTQRMVSAFIEAEAVNNTIRINRKNRI